LCHRVSHVVVFSKTVNNSSLEISKLPSLMRNSKPYGLKPTTVWELLGARAGDSLCGVQFSKKEMPTSLLRHGFVVIIGCVSSGFQEKLPAFSRVE
jgi:hypothetical protein